jgi:hypothetical protein
MIKALERNLKEFLVNNRTEFLPEDIRFNLSQFPEISWSNPTERNIHVDYGDMKFHLSYERMNDTENIYIVLTLIHQEKGNEFCIVTDCRCPYKDAHGSIGYNNNGTLRLQNGFKLEAVIISILSAINTNELEITRTTIV